MPHRLFTQRTPTFPVEPYDKLRWLRRLDQTRDWQFLDDQRHCRCCGKSFTGRQVRLVGGTRSHGSLRIECPTPNCVSTPAEWLYPVEMRTVYSQFRFMSPAAIAAPIKRPKYVPILPAHSISRNTGRLKLRFSVFKSSLRLLHHVGLL